MTYPTDLTTSDWVDYVDTLPSRNEKIAALATMHRRIEAAAHVSAMEQVRAASVTPLPGKTLDVGAVLDAAIAAVPLPVDYPLDVSTD